MHVAISSHNTPNPVNLVKRLLIKGADTSIKNKKGRTALELAYKRHQKNYKLIGLVRCMERSMDVNQSCFTNLKQKLMIQQPLRKQVKSPKLMFFYIGLVCTV